MKANSNSTKILTICHYEDEPQRVEFPSILETMIYKNADFSNVSITGPKKEQYADDGQIYSYFYEILSHTRNENYRILYLIAPSSESIKKMIDNNIKDGNYKSILHIVDMSIGSNKEAGIEIIKHLKKEDVPNGAIWMLTGYPVQSRQILSELEYDIRVISKPTNVSNIARDIMRIFLSNN